MGVGNIAPNGYGPSSAGSSAPGVYATLTGSTAPVPAVSWAYQPSPLSGYGSATLSQTATQSAPPLIQAPSTYQPGANYLPHNAPPFGLAPQDLSQAGSPKKKHSNYIVFYATLMAYGALIGSTIGILTLPGLSRFRGRAKDFTYDAKPDSPNGIERQKRKLSAFDSELRSAKRIKATRDPSEVQGTNPSLRVSGTSGSPGAEGPIKPAVTDTAAIERRYISTAPGDIVHNGYWEKTHAEALNTDVHVGFHAKGATLMGKPVTHEGGVLSVTFPSAVLQDGMTGRFSTLLSQSQKASIHSTTFHVGTERASSTDKPIAISDQHGVHELEHLQFAIPQQGAKEHVESILQSLDIDANGLKTKLIEKKRIGPGDGLHQARQWHEQFELQKNTPHATAGPTKRRVGQVIGRWSEYKKGCLDAWKNPYDGGNRVGLMLLSSTTLTSLLAFTAASLALGMNCHHDKKEDQQNGVSTQ